MASRPVGLGLRTILILSFVGLVPFSANGADPTWTNMPYKYLIIDQDIRDVLIEFGRNIKVPTKLSTAVTGHRIRGSISSKQKLTASAFLQNLCESYGLVWYYDGSSLYIATDDEVKTELVKLNDVKSSVVLRKIVDLGLSNPRFAVRGTDDGNMLSVSGPPAYRSQIRDLVLKLQNDYHERPAREDKLYDTPTVRVFKGGSGS